jgi:hypothetical protein
MNREEEPFYDGVQEVDDPLISQQASSQVLQRQALAFQALNDEQRRWAGYQAESNARQEAAIALQRQRVKVLKEEARAADLLPGIEGRLKDLQADKNRQLQESVAIYERQRTSLTGANRGQKADLEEQLNLIRQLRRERSTQLLGEDARRSQGKAELNQSNFNRERLDDAVGIREKLDRKNLPEAERLILQRQLQELTGRTDQTSLQLIQQRQQAERSSFELKANAAAEEQKALRSNLVFEQERQRLTATRLEQEANLQRIQAREQLSRADRDVRDSESRTSSTTTQTDRSQALQDLERAKGQQDRARQAVAQTDKSFNDLVQSNKQLGDQQQQQVTALEAQIKANQANLNIERERLTLKQRMEAIGLGQDPNRFVGGGSQQSQQRVPLPPLQTVPGALGGFERQIPTPVAPLDPFQLAQNLGQRSPGADFGTIVQSATQQVISALSNQPKIGSLTVQSVDPVADAAQIISQSSANQLRGSGF